MLHMTDVTHVSPQQLQFLFQELVSYVLTFKLPARNLFWLFRQQGNLLHF
jgi:hypothetical protein